METKKKKKKKKPATRIATNTGTDYERVDWDRKNLSRDEGLDLGVWRVVCVKVSCQIRVSNDHVPREGRSNRNWGKNQTKSRGSTNQTLCSKWNCAYVRMCVPRGKGFFAVVVVDLSSAPMLAQRGHLKRLEADEGEEKGVTARVTTP
ncbi:unnamed protein product [Sphagnum tenellum]